MREARGLGHRIERHETLGSTNDRAFELARAGEPEGLVVLADQQTAGRGRQGRRWVSPAGCGLWLSVLLRPGQPLGQVGGLSVIAGVACARATEGLTGLAPRIKWPNDLLLDGRKWAGILVETKSDLAGAYVMGIGINVNQTAAQLPPELRAQATSLALAAGQPVDRGALLQAVLRELDDAYALLLAGQIDQIETDWAARSSQIGQTVQLREGPATYRGTMLRQTLGDIVLRLEDGSERTFRAEHASLTEAS